MIDYKNIIFDKRNTVKQIEEGNKLCPKFNKDGLIPCITIEDKTKEILMLSYLNEEALKKSISSLKAHYYSRSRNSIWIKGEVSGMTHEIKNILVDDDQDSIIFVVKLSKPTKGGEIASCHVGYKSCFYRKVEVSSDKIILEYTENRKAFDPEIIYEGIDNPTKV